MAEPHVITALVKKRSQLAGDLIHLDRQRADLRRRLAYVDHALREFGYDRELSEIAPRRSPKRNFRRNELRRLIAKGRSAVQSPLSNADIAHAVISVKGWDVTDDGLRKRIALLKVELTKRNLTYKQLREKLAELGVVESEPNIRNKLSRGTFSAVFLIQCFEAMGSRSLQLSDG